MSRKATGIVSYITLIGWLFAWIAGDKEGAWYQMNQSLVFHVFSMIINAVFGVLMKIPMLGLVFALIWLLVNIGVFVIWILGVVHAVNDEEKQLPIIGGIQLLR